jgi:hypothetical protein
MQCGDGQRICVSKFSARRWAARGIGAENPVFGPRAAAKNAPKNNNDTIPTIMYPVTLASNSQFKEVSFKIRKTSNLFTIWMFLPPVTPLKSNLYLSHASV